jgi:serine/threonine protein kinase
MKKLFVEDIQDATYIQSEFITMAALHHPNIIHLRSAALGGTGSQISYVLIFMEFFEEGDLEGFIQSRIRSYAPVPEQQIIDWLTKLIDALAFMQEKGIAHRDIKPQNIFLAKNLNEIECKIADLGSAIKKEGNSATLMGTPMYLSPKLREAFSRGNQISFNVEHDLYKSDVYSLGLTILYLASLNSVKDLCSIEFLQKKIDERIMALSNKYPSLVKLLSSMLCVDELFRSDFIELRIKLKSNADIKSLDSSNGLSIGRNILIQELSGTCQSCLKNCKEDNLFVFNDDLLCSNCLNTFLSRMKIRNDIQ